MADAIDWANWPLLEVRTGDTPATDVPTLVGRALREALDREEAFAAVVEISEAPERPGRVRGAIDHVRMVKRLRPGLAERCRGLAMVVPAATRRDNAKLIRSGPKIWGCPTTAVDDLEQARAWARARLSAVGPADTSS